MPRVEDALSNLVSSILPALPGEQDADADGRQQDALALAHQTLDEYGPVREAVDPGRLRDVIHKKLWRDFESPDKAIRFNNLYTRLLTLPILNRKSAILQLFNQLSDDESFGDALPSSPRSPRQHRAPEENRPSELDSNRPALADASEARSNQSRTQEPQPPPRSEHQSPERPERTKIDDSDAQSSNRKSQPVIPTFVGNPAPSESALLRDLPFTLQGLSSTNLQFASSDVMNLPPDLPLPVLSLLHTLAEPSLLYRSLSDFVQSREKGLVEQSLRAAIGIELRSYLGLIATLEAEIRRAVTAASKQNEQSRPSKIGVTLKRCVVWTREATTGLRLMSLMAEESKRKRGGVLISLIHSFSMSYGDPFVSAFAERMLAHLTRPFYDMLRQWIYDGELIDPYHEFFVVEPKVDKVMQDLDPRTTATSVWEDKYQLDKEQIPSIITDDFARKIFLIGKSLNFIRYGCGDSSWVEAYSKDNTKELRYGDTAGLEKSIDKAYKTVMARLVQLMNEKFMLFDHLWALKKYLLLGQGDFVAFLVESIASYLDRPAGTQYRHTLTAQLDSAVRGSNAQYEPPEILKRLDARLLELSHGDIGWDVFTLDYKVDAPVDVVITPWASKQYLVVFNFLWRIKRVEYALGATWRRLMTGARGVLAAVPASLAPDWKAARCCVSEMIHFVNQLQYYVLFEVVEASWEQLQAALAAPDATLDDLVQAHATYLRNITHKGLLGRPSPTGQREDSFTSQLHYLLKVMLAYRDAVDGLYSFSVADFTRRQEAAARVETRTAAGAWGRSDADLDGGGVSPAPIPGDRLRARNKQRSAAAGLADAAQDDMDNAALPALLRGSKEDADQMLPSLRGRLRELKLDFRARLSTLLGDLMVQPDPDMKFLGVVMNFNDVYRPTKRKKDRTRDKGKGTPGAEPSRADSRVESRMESRAESRA